MKTTQFFIAAGLAAVVSTTVAHAGDTDAKAAPPAKSAKTKALDIKMPAFGAIPSAEGLKAKEPEKIAMTPTITPGNATYEVVKVQHARGRSPIQEVELSGNPQTSDRFSTVVRVKSPQKVNTSIDVLIVDGRGQTAMSSSGEVSFRNKKSDQADFAIDWDPTPFRSGGDYRVMVKLGGQDVGSWPLKFVAKN
jgi:hypothetical protein